MNAPTGSCRVCRSLGKNQIERLLGLASPSSLLIVGDDRVCRSLVKRGLLAPHFPNDRHAWLRITPTGMRVLADLYAAGCLNQFFKEFPPNQPPNLSAKPMPDTTVKAGLSQS